MTKEKILGIISLPLAFLPGVLFSFLEVIFKINQWWNFYLYYTIACLFSILIFFILKSIFDFKLSDVGFTKFRWSFLGWAFIGFIIPGLLWHMINNFFCFCNTNFIESVSGTTAYNSGLLSSELVHFCPNDSLRRAR